MKRMVLPTALASKFIAALAASIILVFAAAIFPVFAAAIFSLTAYAGDTKAGGGAATASSSHTPDGPLARIKDGYAAIKDLKGSFVQTSKLKDLKKEMTFKGTFFIKIPGKMHWRYEETGKEEQVFINGPEIIVYQKKQGQAIRRKSDENTIAQTPIALLSGLKNIDTLYDAFERDEHVRFVPKNVHYNITHFDVFVARGDFPVGKLVAYDKKGNEIEIVFKDVKINTGVPDSTFVFTPPAGVKVVDN
jgi:outer membrane lipoprotein carrier protein